MRRGGASGPPTGPLVYLLIGFELVSSMGDEIKEPEKQIPRAFFTSGALTAFLYVFATVGIRLSLSLHKLTLVQGLIDTFKAIFGSHGAGEVAVYVLGIGALYTYFTNMTTWSMGANRAVAEAASDGELPSFLGREDQIVGALAAVATFVIAATALFFMWPEIPHRPAQPPKAPAPPASALPSAP